MLETIKGWFTSRELTAEELQIISEKQQQIFIRNMIREIVELAHEQANAGWFYAAYRLPLYKDPVVEDSVQHRLTILGYDYQEKVGNDSRRYLAITWKKTKNEPQTSM